ncbi:hypothetical protein J2T02_005658 [Chitinophaga terrae (ex Kim and Jung 2007)]|uniref:hypothetical protein n=1 Tax=Chitinophaga terrae (ex Kim and Jung 2007) TaxID=408074 RepID=UPI00277FCDBC|nr:hypothetical protein [Chitinophaga terrae (ex Kim and Jung 2007)]MDQ0110506.1 hypothetical protein [Chitinophaga terrae (ex Kim and Jung 2007)]
MAIIIIEEDQYISLYKKNKKLHQIIVTDLDRPFLSGRDVVSHHIRMVSFHVWREMQCLYQLGRIIQTKYPSTIKAINWPMTYFNAEYDDYISKLATFNFSLGINPAPTDYIDRIITERFDIADKESGNTEINRGIVYIVRQRMNEYGLIF